MLMLSIISISYFIKAISILFSIWIAYSSVNIASTIKAFTIIDLSIILPLNSESELGPPPLLTHDLVFSSTSSSLSDIENIYFNFKNANKLQNLHNIT